MQIRNRFVFYFCVALTSVLVSSLCALAQGSPDPFKQQQPDPNGQQKPYSLENDPVTQNILFLQIIDTSKINVPSFTPLAAPIRRTPIKKDWNVIGKKLMEGFIVDRTDSLQRTPLGMCDIYTTKDNSIFKIYQNGIEWSYGLSSIKKAFIYDFEEIKKRNEKPSSKPLPPPIIKFITAEEARKIALDYIKSTIGFIPQSKGKVIVEQVEEFEAAADKLYTLKLFKTILIKQNQIKLSSTKTPINDFPITMVDDYIEVKVDGNKRVVSATIKWFEGDNEIADPQPGINGIEAVNAARKSAIAAYNNNPPTFTLNNIQLAYVTLREDLSLAYPVWLMDLRYNETSDLNWKPSGNQTMDALSHKYGTKVDTISLAYGIDAISGKPYQL